MVTDTGNGWFAGGPEYKRDRARFFALSLEDKLWVESRAKYLHRKGNDTAWSWRKALSECW